MALTVLATTMALYATPIDGVWETDYLSRTDGWFVKFWLEFSEGQATLTARASTIPPFFPHSCDIVQKGRYTVTDFADVGGGMFDVDFVVESAWFTLYDPESALILNGQVSATVDPAVTPFVIGVPKEITGFSHFTKEVEVAKKGYRSSFRLQLAEDKLYAPAFWIPGVVKAVPSPEQPSRATNLVRESPFFRK
jgi:hypothetical protein